MLTNLALGTLLIMLTVLMHMGGMILLTHIADWIVERFSIVKRHARTFVLVMLVYGLFAVHTLELWLWAFAFWATGAIQHFADALYFSAITFSTVGYGDVQVAEDWRLMASLEAMNGFLLIGWSTAFLVAASTRIGPFRSGHHF